MCEQNPDFRVGRHERRADQLSNEGASPWETGGSWRGAGGYRAAPYLRGPRSRVTLAFLWGRGAASLVRRKRPQPQHTRREGRSNLYVPRTRSGSGRTRAASPDSAAHSASLLRLERPSNDEAPKRTWQLPHRTRCGNRHRKLGAHYFDEGFFT